MGEIAEMMLTGVMCGVCGVYLECEDCEDMGIPMYCSRACANNAGANQHQVCNL